MMSARAVCTALLVVAGGVGVGGCEGVLKETSRSGSPSAVGVLDAGPVVNGDAECDSTSCSEATGDGGGTSGTPVCGDGRRTVGEQCDDGNVATGDGCNDLCVAELVESPPQPCGDGVLDTLREECDDGNTDPGDGCDWRCRNERCGNGRDDVGEDCDPPITGVCSRDCRTELPNCGDGELQQDEGEACDDGNAERGDGCASCHVECGDDRLERDIGEECEPKYASEGTCDEDTCKRLPLCGDGQVNAEAGEQCDPSDGVTCVDCKISLDAGGGDGGTEAPLCSSELASVAVINGKFASDTASWIPASDTVTASHVSEGATTPGSLLVTYAPGVQPGASVNGVEQCVPIIGNVQYKLVAEYFNPAANAVDVLPSITIRLYSNTTCTGGFTSGSGPPASAGRDSWYLYTRDIDTSSLGDAAGSLMIKVGVILPAGVASGQMRWDSVALGSCGNCVAEGEAGEACDDGNLQAGDGCSASCEFECGNGAVEAPEQCDDGNFTFGDSCTPSCRAVTACDTCANTSCATPVDACLALEGVATAGPSKGMARGALCSQLRDCIHASGCNLNTAIANRPSLAGELPTGGLPENCFCGSSGVDCMQPGRANGSCRSQIAAALETDDAYQIIQRVGGFDPDYPAFDAVVDLLSCEQTQCTAQCSKTISCGNGFREDRSQEFVTQFQFTIDRLPQPCLDEYTHTQTGCSFEECDDGNTSNDDGCDENCFQEACGNYLKQGDEECDDGNLVDGDGCDSSCVAEYVCGDAEVTDPFEECEPPGTGSLCSLAEYEDEANRASTCGCDDACIYKVCGNDIVQEGEECDPPNGASCNDTCQRNIDDCTECMLLLDDNQLCRKMWLLGSGIPDQFEVGCLNESSCLDMWDCMRESQCALETGIAACYCGDGADFNACEGPAYVPTGVCKAEFLEAFEVQWGRPPTGNSEVLSGVLPSAGNNNPYSVAINIAQRCYLPDTYGLSLRVQLEQSGVASEVIDTCINSCFP